MMSLVLPLPCPAPRSPCDALLLKQQAPCKNSCPPEVMHSCSKPSTPQDLRV